MDSVREIREVADKLVDTMNEVNIYKLENYSMRDEMYITLSNVEENLNRMSKQLYTSGIECVLTSIELEQEELKSIVEKANTELIEVREVKKYLKICTTILEIGTGILNKNPIGVIDSVKELKKIT